MDSQSLLIFAAVAAPVIFMLLWWEFRTSGCAYGGSNQGEDNWLVMQMKKRVREYQARRADREPRDVSDI